MKHRITQDSVGTPPGGGEAGRDVRWIRKIRIDLRMSDFTSGWCESRMQQFTTMNMVRASGKVFKDEQGHQWLDCCKTNRDTVATVLLFYFSSEFAILRRFAHEVPRDNTIACVSACMLLKRCCANGTLAGKCARRAFASEQPFCLDTMERWSGCSGINSRMHQLLESEMPLPQNFAVAPYYEMALDNTHPVREQYWRNWFCWCGCGR